MQHVHESILMKNRRTDTIMIKIPSFFTLLLLILMFTSCDKKTKKGKGKLENKEVSSPPINFTEMGIDSLWNFLLFKQGGCLVGAEYVSNGKFGSEACVMSASPGWKNFFSRDKQEIKDFLLSKISNDTSESKIHTCPNRNSIAPEVAVYALQNHFKVNWYDFEDFKSYQDKLEERNAGNKQTWLQEILKNDDQRETLLEYYKNLQ